jgi:hypothetical protein
MNLNVFKQFRFKIIIIKSPFFIFIPFRRLCKMVIKIISIVILHYCIFYLWFIAKSHVIIILNNKDT